MAKRPLQHQDVSVTDDGKIEVEGSFNVSSGSALQEQKSQANATGGTVTFAAPVTEIDILNRDTSNAGVFTVNGIAITVPAGAGYGPIRVGGTPGANVTVTGSTSYLLGRFS